MNLEFPRPSDLIAGKLTAGPEWYRWFQRLRASLGWDRAHPIWSDLVPQITAWTGGAVGTFIAGQNDSIAGAIHLPNTYRPGSPLHPYAIIVGTSVTEAEASLTLSSLVVEVGSPVGSPTTETKYPTVGDVLQVVEFSEVSGEDVEPNDVLVVTLERAAVDSYGGDIRLLAFGAKYRVYGSGQEERFP